MLPFTFSISPFLVRSDTTRPGALKADFLHEISVRYSDQPNVVPPAENESPQGHSLRAAELYTGPTN
jgi:hypothetical protein